MRIRFFIALCVLLGLAARADAWLSSRGANVGPEPGGQLVQVVRNQTTGPSAGSIVTSLPGVVAGDALIVEVDACASSSGAFCDSHAQSTGTNNITSITGTGGTCANATGPTLGANPTEVWVCSNVSAGNLTVTVNLPTTAHTRDLGATILEVLAGNPALETANNAWDNGLSGTFEVSTSGNTSYNDFLYSRGTASIAFTQLFYPGPPWLFLSNVTGNCDDATTIGEGTLTFCEIYRTGSSFQQYNAIYNSFATSPFFDAVIVALHAPPSVGTKITRAVPSNNKFAGGSPNNTVVGHVQVSMIGAPFSGTLALSGTDAAKFKLSSTTLPSDLELNGTQNGGTYNLNIVPTQGGAINSGVAQPIVITGTTTQPWGVAPVAALWYDPSDASTTFTDTGCTAASHVTGATIKCIKDKSASGCSATNSTGWTLTNSGALWFLSGATVASGITSCAAGIFQNVGYANVHFAGTPPSDSQSTPFAASINGGAGSARLYCGVDAGGTTGKGFGVRLRRLDSDSGVNVEAGTYVGALKAVSCRVAYAGASSSAAIFVNNVSVASNSSVFTPGGNTSNTPSDEVSLFTLSSFGTAWSGPFYGLVVDTPASAPSGTIENAVDSYLCTQAGLTC